MKKMKRWVKVLLCIVLAFVLVVGAYVAYVFIDYHRIGAAVLSGQDPDGGLCRDRYLPSAGEPTGKGRYRLHQAGNVERRQAL